MFNKNVIDLLIFFLKIIISSRKKNSQNTHIIKKGDFNDRVGNVADSDVVGKYGLGTRNERGSRLVSFCKQNSFEITNTFSEVPFRRRYTWRAPGYTTQYQLNYILVKSHNKNQVKYSHRFLRADINSDYKLAIMKCWVRSKN